jgi:beta-mannosidase
LGQIPDPFVSDQELQVQWVAEKDWQYRIRFAVDDALLAEERIFLVCDGLDTLADVTLNGRTLGSTDNAFRQYRWDVTDVVAPEGNELDILFHSTVKAMLASQAEEPLIGPSQSIPGGPYIRKAPCQFGWDWGPQLPPVGVWRSARLEGYSTARLADVHLRQVFVGSTVTVKADVAIERWNSGDLLLTMRVVGPDGETQETALELTDARETATVSVQVDDPQLWWPNGYGAQPLYDVDLGLGSSTQILDRRHFALGLRQLQLRQSEDEFGTSFTFIVNGIPVFAKGANWIPADSFPSRITTEHLEGLIRSAAHANMNMLRVWGGGLYEDDRFYDLCDRYGILIWQDFIFSCSTYPDDAGFVANVREEVTQNIRRLRHHACLGLWCGNNEMEWGWVGWGWPDRVEPRYRAAYDDMFHRLLPALCAEYDPDTPYWPSSPSSGTPFVEPGGVHAGDTHNWEVWHGGHPFEHYRSHPSRFVSEFGFQSLPSLETVKTYAQEPDWNMTSYVMEHHQRNSAGNGKIITYLTDHFRLPKDFASLVYLTQVLQAEAVRTGVEFWRRSRACTSGTLYWQLNDCWPVASWSSLDYYGRWKALHYVARRFYAPVLISAEKRDYEHRSAATTHETGYLFQPKPGPFVDLFVTNDRPEPWNGTMRWSLETLSGEVLADESRAVEVPGLAAIQVADLSFQDLVGAHNERFVVMVYELLEGDRRVSMGVLPFVPSKHLSLSDPELTVLVSPSADGFDIALRASALARFVSLALQQQDVVFSDNYFDLPAGRSITVKMPSIGGWDVDRVGSALVVRSLVDSY